MVPPGDMDGAPKLMPARPPSPPPPLRAILPHTHTYAHTQTNTHAHARTHARNSDWPDIMQSYMITATKKLLGSSYVEDDLVDGVPSGLDVDAAQFHFRPLHALVAYGRGLPVSHLSVILSPAAVAAATAAANPSAAAAAAAKASLIDAASAFEDAAEAAGMGDAAPVLPWPIAAARVKAEEAQGLLISKMKLEAQGQGPAAAAAVAGKGQQQEQTTTTVAAAAAAGFDCNARDGYSRTGLHWAATTGQADWISALIRAGGDPNAADIRQVPPLQDAIEAEHADAVRSLLEGGADKDVRLDGDIGGNGDGGGTPLVLAAVRGNSEIVRLLCAAGAGLEGNDGVGFSALMTAVAHRHLGVAEVLLEHGADADTEVRFYVGALPARMGVCGARVLFDVELFSARQH